MAVYAEGEFYGLEAGYEVPDEASAVHLAYIAQIHTTRRAAGRVEAEIRRLKEQPEAREKSSNVHSKLEYLTVQMEFYKSVMEIFTANDAVIQRKNAHTYPGAGEETIQIRLYRDMTRVLATMGKGFRRVLGLPETFYGEMYRKSKAFLARNPKKVAAGAVGLAAGLACFLALRNAHVGYCSVARLFGCGCSSWGVGGSALAGGAIGLIVAGIAIGLIKLFQEKEPQELHSLERRQREDLEKMVQQMRKMTTEEIANDITRIQELTQGAFCQPTFAPGAEAEGEGTENVCLVCLVGFGDDADAEAEAEGMEPVRAPMCQARHFMHKTCWEEWATTSGNRRCPTCGV